MNKLFRVACFLIPHLSCGQKVKWDKVAIDSKDNYNIPGESKVVNTLFDVPETQDTVRSGLILNNDTLFTILFTKAKLQGDTLRILIHQTDPAYHHEYIITVVKDRYNVNYDLRTPVDPATSKMAAFENGKAYHYSKDKKGNLVKGKEYDGKNKFIEQSVAYINSIADTKKR